MKRSAFKRKALKLKRRASVSCKEMQWSKAVRARDNFQCQFPRCFFISRSIDAHHIAMRSRRPDLKFVTENGVCLCRDHHSWVHSHQAEANRMGLLSSDSYEKAMRVISTIQEAIAFAAD